MRIQQNKHHLVILFMMGFVCGILYANFIARTYVTVTGIFHEYFLNQYTQTEIVTEDYLLYLIQWRVVPFVFLAFTSNTKIRKPAALSYLLWTGFSAGVLAVGAVLRMGAKGMLLCIAALFPQIIFYALAYIIVLWYVYCYPESRWNNSKAFFVIFMMAAGIIMEAYVNPGMLKWIMKILV